MIINITIILMLIIWIIIYLKKKKIIISLPYLFIIFITPFYNFLDQKIFVKVFGCGCVPIAQTNMLNIDFNANDLRRLIYFVISIMMIILGIKLSKLINKKLYKIIYITTIIVLNLLIMFYICKTYMWA